MCDAAVYSILLLPLVTRCRDNKYVYGCFYVCCSDCVGMFVV